MTASLDLFAGLEERIRAIVDEHIDARLEELHRSPYMNVKETAEYLRVGESRIYKLSAIGKIPHFKQDGRLLFDRAKVDAWLAEHHRGPTTATTKTDDPEVASLLEEILQHPTRGEALPLRSEANGPKVVVQRKWRAPRERSRPDTEEGAFDA